MEVARGAKFAACFLSQCVVADDVPGAGVEVAAGIWAARRFGAELERHWPVWLGTLTIDQLKKAGLALYVTACSSQPEILDDENEFLKLRIERVYQALLIQVVPDFSKGFSVTGANVNGEVQIRQFGSLRPAIRSSSLRRRVTLADVRGAVTLAPRLQFLQEQGGVDRWARLRRSIRVLFFGTEIENSAGDKLHQFVRVLEGLTLPREGQSTADFAHRCQTFARVRTNSKTLRQLYELRNHVEHMHEASLLLPGSSERERFALADHRTRQADLLARFALGRVLTSDALFQHYRSDADIAAFWRLQDGERRRIFGKPIDLDAIR